jgi:hypothetical protein
MSLNSCDSVIALPVVPARTDDEVYRTTREKYDAVVRARAGVPKRRTAGAGRHGQHRKAEALSAVFKNVGAAPGHVGGDRHRAGLAGLGDDIGLVLVIARVQHVVGILRYLEMRLRTDLAPIKDAAVHERQAAAIVLRQHPPPTAGPRDMEDRIEHGPQLGLARSAQTLNCRHMRLDQRPLRIREIAYVALSLSLILQSSNFAPHLCFDDCYPQPSGHTDCNSSIHFSVNLL